MKKRKIGLLILFPIVLFAQQPKLVVGIVVDQMRYDYLYRFSQKYGNGGFKRLLKEGFECKNAQYNYVPTFTGPGHASIFTGTTPAIHGIAANEWFDKSMKSKKYCVYDGTVKPVGTNDKSGLMSPANLDATTIGDELEITTGKRAKVIAVSLKDRSSVLPAGHAADAGYWFDQSTGNFITSTFYRKDLPGWLNDFNAKKLAIQYLKYGWSPLLPIEKYTESITDENAYEKSPNKKAKPVFPYSYQEDIDKGNFDILRSTPYGNDITRDLAIAAIEGEQLGMDSISDMLCVSFSSTDYVGHSFGPSSIELEDTYIRLDKDLEDLLNHLDNKVGKNNYTVFLTADHGAAEVPAYLQSMKINAGYVDAGAIKFDLTHAVQKEFKELLVLEYVNQQVYLDDELILQKKLDKDAIEKFCANWLLNNNKDILDVVTGSSIRAGGPEDVLFRGNIQRGYHPKRSGDIFVTYKPGYMEHEVTGTTHGTPYSYDTHVPIVFFGKGIITGSTLRPVYITDIASTICQLLRIPYTNGNIGNPVFEAIK